MEFLIYFLTLVFVQTKAGDDCFRIRKQIMIENEETRKLSVDFAERFEPQMNRFLKGMHLYIVPIYSIITVSES